MIEEGQIMQYLSTHTLTFVGWRPFFVELTVWSFRLICVECGSECGGVQGQVCCWSIQSHVCWMATIFCRALGVVFPTDICGSVGENICAGACVLLG